MPLSNHKWGVCRYADRVWAQVAGLAPIGAERRLLMPTQCFVDDSYKTNGRGPYVLGGAVATAEKWVEFSKEWSELLQFCRIQKNGKREFKYSQMHGSPYMPAFYRTISKNVLFIVSFSFNKIDLVNAINRIWISGHAAKPAMTCPMKTWAVLPTRCLGKTVSALRWTKLSEKATALLTSCSAVSASAFTSAKSNGSSDLWGRCALRPKRRAAQAGWRPADEAGGFIVSGPLPRQQTWAAHAVPRQPFCRTA